MQVMMRVPFWETRLDMPKQAARAGTRAGAGAPQKESNRRGAHISGDLRTEEKSMGGYTGLLLVKCEQCGKVHGFRSKLPITHSRCNCGHETKLHDLCAAHLRCKCGRGFTYQTNMNEERFDFHCFNCGNPVDLERNKRGNAYVTMA